MKKIIALFTALMIFLMVFASCKTEQENSDEQVTTDNFKEDATPETTGSLGGQANKNEDITDAKRKELEELIKKGSENKNQYNGVYYKTEFVGKDGEVFTSETWLNIETTESKIDYYFVDEDGTLTKIILYRLMSGTHIYSPSDNFIINLPMTAAELVDNIPLVPLVPAEPMTVDDISNGLDLLEFKGYEESAEGEYLVYTHTVEGRIHIIWLDKKTGLLAKQTITSDEGTMEFYGYRYFDISDEEFILPEDVPSM